MAQTNISIREATSADLPAVVQLLRERDGLDYEASAVENIVFGLEPELFHAWIAWVAGEPAGLNCCYLRTLRWDGTEKKAGYWAHLFVPERYRKLMVYPGLMAAMIRGAHQLGLEVIFTATRHAGVVESSVKLGFRMIGNPALLMRPLRLTRLAAKYTGFGSLAALGAPLDGLLGALTIRANELSDVSVEELELDSPDISRIVDLLDIAGSQRISQTWTADYFHRRFTGTLESRHYTVLVARRGGGVSAAVIHRLADERNGIRIGVIMDVLYRGEDDLRAARMLVRQAQHSAYAADADMMMALEISDTGLARALKPLGYFKTWERYHIMVWPKAAVSEGSWASDIRNWRFTLSDHDAF